jgi:hypothetical protein
MHLKNLRDISSVPKDIGNSLGKCLLAMLTEQRIHFGKCPNKNGDLTDAYPKGSPANRIEGDLLGLSPTISPLFWAFSVYFWEAKPLKNKLNLTNRTEKYIKT